MKYLLQSYFSEKNLPNEEWVIHTEKMEFLVESQRIRDIIINHSKEDIQVEIWGKLQLIDFNKGDVNHYLYQLAKVLVQNYPTYFTGVIN